jgi:hypothetical protein
VEDKDYTFTAGLRALADTLSRRGLDGSSSDIATLWKGNYRVHLTAPTTAKLLTVRLAADDLKLTNYQSAVTAAVNGSNQPHDFIVILGPGIEPDAGAIDEMLGWFQIQAVGMVTGKVIDGADRLLHGGLVLRPDGSILSVYQGFPESEPGYMAVTSIARNVSIPHPCCVAIRSALWHQLVGLQTDYCGPYAMLDLALRAAAAGYRHVYNPFSRYCTTAEWQGTGTWPEADRNHFQQRWQAFLAAGDPYYNCHLSLEHGDMRLRERDSTG